MSLLRLTQIDPRAFSVQYLGINANSVFNVFLTRKSYELKNIHLNL